MGEVYAFKILYALSIHAEIGEQPLNHLDILYGTIFLSNCGDPLFLNFLIMTVRHVSDPSPDGEEASVKGPALHRAGSMTE